MHEEMIDYIVKNGTAKSMECLRKVMVEMLDDLSVMDESKYKMYEYKLYKAAYGDHLTEELARKWVSGMTNKDGTRGEHWSYEQTSQLAGNHNKWDWYAVLNMMYSDYYNQRFDTNIYVQLANDWLDDRDVGDGKTLCYYWKVVNR